MPFRAGDAHNFGGACFYLILQLSDMTKLRFVVWFALGIIIYFAYSQRHSTMHRDEEKSARGR